MNLERDYLEVSSIAQGWLEDARKQAREQTRVEEARKFLRLGLRKKFPELSSIREIDEISDLQTLESLVESVYDASSGDTVRAAILAAAKPN